MMNHFVKFVNQTILRRSKESTALTVNVISILQANVVHTLRFKRNKRLELKAPNKTVLFPLSSRWTNSNPSKSQQETYMVVKQVTKTLNDSGIDKRTEIDRHRDKSKATIEVMGFTSSLTKPEMDDITKVYLHYGPHNQVQYNLNAEVIFADSLLNGQFPYYLRKFNHLKQIRYDFEKSRQIQANYVSAVKQAFTQETLNQKHLKTIGLTKEQLLNRINSGQGLYSMMFEHLQNLTGGEPRKNKPKIFIDNEVIHEQYCLQVPYPIFLKLSAENIICIGVGFRYEKGAKVRIFSPFFQSQHHKLWNLARSHLAQAVFNDFHVRVHLGILHFTTNQYNVPIYNSLAQVNANKKQNLNHFLDFTYSVFNKGLEGVNVAATASLVYPVAQYSLVNKVFNLSQQDALTLIANYSNKIDLTSFDPRSLLKKNGLLESDVQQFEHIRLDIELYDILSKYIDQVYKLYEIDEISDVLLKQIQKETRNMVVGKKQDVKQFRPAPKTKEEVLKLIKNLAFCWFGFHSHTFSTVTISMYWMMRPTILKSSLPHDSKNWKDIIDAEEGSQLPNTKIIMEAGKLSQSTTQRDADNFILDVLKRKDAEILLNWSITPHGKKRQTFSKLHHIINSTIRDLEQFGQKVDQANVKRLHPTSNKMALLWLHPSRLQASLNI